MVDVENKKPVFDRTKLNEPEKLLVLRQHRARPHGSKEARRFLPGETYVQTGLDKWQVIGTGYATLDLDAKVPENKKRKAPSPEEAKIKNMSPANFMMEILKQNQEILNTLASALKKKL